MLIQEIIGKKVTIHVEAGSNVQLHRGILEAADAQFIRIKKDNDTLYFGIGQIVEIQPVL